MAANQGGGGQSPWSRGPGGGGQPPDFEEMLRRGQDRMKNLVPGGMGPGKVGALIAGVAVLLWLASGLYQVQPAERGVPLLFGKFSGELTEPGLHWNWPAPIGSVLTPNVDAQNTVEIGFRGSASGASTNSTIEEESLILTGDENIIQVEAVVQWFIDDVQKYLFEIRDPNEALSPDSLKQDTVKNAAEAAIRETIGQAPFEVIITGEGREEAGKKAQALAQRILDSYNSGIKIERLSLQRSYAPQDVAEAFRDVVRAGADAQSTVNDATAYKNQVTQQALGQASQIKNQAEGYRAEKIAVANGDAQRFIQVYDQYKQNPEVTSRRLYLETLEEIMGNMNKVLIDTDQGGGAVPYLPLDQLMRKQPQPQPAPSQTPAAGHAGAVGKYGNDDRERQLMNRGLTAAIVVVVVALILAYSATFFVHQSQNAVVVRFGKLVDMVENDPGLHWRVPFVDHVTFIDRRVINVDAPSFELLTSDQKFLVVSAYVRYRITDTEQVLSRGPQRTDGGTPPGGRAERDAARPDRFGPDARHPVREARGADGRSDQAAEAGRRRVRHPGRRRSVQARRPAAAEQRSGLQPHAHPARPGSNPDPRRRTGAGAGDPRGSRPGPDGAAGRDPAAGPDPARRGRRARRPASTTMRSGRDPQFFDLYRSLQAMRTGLGGNNTTFVGSPKGDFFRFFEQSARYPRQSRNNRRGYDGLVIRKSRRLASDLRIYDRAMRRRISRWPARHLSDMRGGHFER